MGARRDFHIGRPRADTRSPETLAHDHLDLHRLTSSVIQARTGDQQGNVPHYASGDSARARFPDIQNVELASVLDSGYSDVTRVVQGNNARSSLPVIRNVGPSTGLASGCTAVTQASFQLVLPGPDDSPQISHHKVGPPGARRPTSPARVDAPAGRPHAGHPLRGRKKKFVPAPPSHPRLLSGKPISVDVELIEVKAQEQPLFSLGVLEQAAKQIEIFLRLETCPAEDGASWLLMASAACP